MKIKIKTNLWSGIVMGVFSIIMLLILPSQVRVPAFDSGAPSPRIIPGICLVGMLICSAALLIQSLVFKKEKEFEFDWAVEKPCILMILGLCVYTAMIIYLGFVIASVVIFPCCWFTAANGNRLSTFLPSRRESASFSFSSTCSMCPCPPCRS